MGRLTLRQRDPPLARPRERAADAGGGNDGDGGIDAVISASIGHRSPDQAAGLARLSVFASGFTADAAEAVAQLHPLVVSHARRLLDQFGAAADTQARHRSYFARLAGDLLSALHGSADDLDQPDALQVMACDGENILRAWNDAVAERDVDALERMAEPMMIWLLQANRLSELLRSLRAGIAAVGEPRSVPLLLFPYEYISWLAGTIDPASVRSLAVVAELGEDSRSRDRSIGRLIAAYLAAAVLGRPADAELALEELRREAKVLPDFWEVRRLLLVGILRSAAGEHKATLEVRSFVSSLEALYAGLEGDPVAAARAHGEIDCERVQNFLREP